MAQKMPYRMARVTGCRNRVTCSRKRSTTSVGKAIAACTWAGRASHASNQRGGLPPATDRQPFPVGVLDLVRRPRRRGHGDEVVGERLLGQSVQLVLGNADGGERLELELREDAVD